MGEKKVVDNEKKKKATRALFVSNRKRRKYRLRFLFATVEEGKGISVERFDRRMLVCAAHETR